MKVEIEIMVVGEGEYVIFKKDATNERLVPINRGVGDYVHKKEYVVGYIWKRQCEVGMPNVTIGFDCDKRVKNEEKAHELLDDIRKSILDDKKCPRCGSELQCDRVDRRPPPPPPALGSYRLRCKDAECFHGQVTE